jgi:signal transduction histidine kinase
MILENFTLLYVEDEPTIVDEMKMLLEDEVKELYIANNGEEGLALYKEKQPDIILTDIQMPKLNGIEMSRIIKKENYSQPIIILTAFDNPDLLKEAINISVDKYILKPVTNDEQLYSTLEDVAIMLQSKIDHQRTKDMLESQSKIAAMGEMIGHIAHQWRQPLNVISTIATGIDMQIKMDMLKTDELKRGVEKISTTTSYLSQTIDDFRDFFKDDETRLVPFNVKDTLKKIFDLVHFSFDEDKIHIVFESQSCGEVMIKQNENKLIQALINIFNNARDAMSNDDNNIQEIPNYLFVDLKEDEENIIITIKDSGGGIFNNNLNKCEDLNKIFAPYFTTKHQSEGTGIGMYMTYQIIVKHFDGSIKVTNQHYKHKGHDLVGAEFEICLPKITSKNSDNLKH